MSIAVELLTRPGLLLLDEPTTGLDSTNAARVVEVLAGLAGGGVNVLLSIHQPRPDVLRAMDRLLLMSGDGQVSDRHPSAALLSPAELDVASSPPTPLPHQQDSEL